MYARINQLRTAEKGIIMAIKRKKLAYLKKKNMQSQKGNCQNKRRYNSPVDAIASALGSKERSGCTDDLFYYKCPLCKGHHLTKNAGGTSILAA